VIQAGAAAALGLAGADLLSPRGGWFSRNALAAAGDTPAPFGRAKSCIFLFMWGGPSQLDTFDLKQNAPREVRGEFQPIDTNVPGLQICEHFEQLARHADKLTVIRSLTHDDPAHLSSGHYALTGHLAPIVKSDDTPPSDRDWPHLGSTLSKMRPANGVPQFVTMPWLANHPAAPGGNAPGQNGGFLGRLCDPLLVRGDPNGRRWRVEELALADDVSYDRLTSRQSLLGAIDRQRRELAEADYTGVKRQAVDCLTSPRSREAFDLSREPDSIRDRYGRNIHGQCVLLARRLVERGVSLVSVNWHNDGRNFWDTHGQNFSRLKNDLIPPADRALAALLEDLADRGMLDETLVAWVGEFGRQPRIDSGNASDGGRAHWPRCYSGLLAGGGIRGGAVHGASDQQGAYPADSPVQPADYAATMLYALGVDPALTLHDRLARPIKICEGRPLLELFR
jgi:hypothetical protein